MKKQILKTITFLGLLFSSNLFAITPPTQEYKEIVDSFKLIDTSEKELSQTFRVNGEKIKLELEKQDKYEECYKYQAEYDEYERCYDNINKEDSEWQDVQHIIRIEERSLEEQKVWRGIYKYDQKLFAITCISNENNIFLTSVVRSSFKRGKKIHFGELVSQIYYDNDLNQKRNQSFTTDFFYGYGLSSYTSISTYNPKEFYPYFNEKRILARLYETNTCNKELTEKANIEILVNGKWLPQEQSWNIKDNE
ncbi:hypothetical protein [Arcobacter vandammei]|uniref:hypothetical protein n=1 Tax=Arcobacter vandammei TaxID=2782243 RepID=UPI0018E05EA4|nr:hypothetical protein [Arcobacter vandammei]